MEGTTFREVKHIVTEDVADSGDKSELIITDLWNKGTDTIRYICVLNNS